MSAQADIAMIGLGVMGRSLAHNLAGHGRIVAVFDRSAGLARDLAREPGFIACDSLIQVAAALTPPRAVMVMVPAGRPVDEVLAELRTALQPGDRVIDGGNSHFRDTIRRAQELAAGGIDLLGLGISGGEAGARHGPSVMAGGARSAWDAVADLYRAIAARHEGEPCAAWFGGDGAGHFVKTMHNGIEYADMQAIAEVYGALRDGLGMTASQAGDTFAAWDRGPLGSYLLEITADILARRDVRSGIALVDTIVDRAGQKGTGQWAAAAALELGVAAPSLAAAVAARAVSAAKPEREATEAALGAPARRHAGDGSALMPDLHDALLGTRIATYAQGLMVIAAARGGFAWPELNLAEVARVWQGGCIIRARLLDDIRAGLTAEPAATNLLRVPALMAALQRVEPGWRRIVAAAAIHGWPAPALGAALAWYDGLRTGRSTANLIQAQRDYFGAHGVERIGQVGTVHLDWPAGDAT
jgi:6-phosphogluconate dehydrogenase